jgi:hypothetical protein
VIADYLISWRSMLRDKLPGKGQPAKLAEPSAKPTPAFRDDHSRVSKDQAETWPVEHESVNGSS